MLEAAIQVVSPLVIGANQHADRRFARLFETSAAVAADVAVGANLLIVIAQYHDRGLADIGGKNIAGLGNVSGHCNQYPVFGEEYIDVGFEYILPTENFAWKTTTKFPGSYDFSVSFNRCNVHLYPSGTFILSMTKLVQGLSEGAQNPSMRLFLPFALH
jgi:hypothetical protein